MLDFKPFATSQQPQVQPLLSQSPIASEESSFACLYAWAGIFASQIAIDKGYAIVRSGTASPSRPDGSLAYLYPFGPAADPHWVWDMVLADILTLLPVLRPASCHLTCFTQEQADAALRVFARFAPISETPRNLSDYVYSADALSSLAGKKYQSKRNHISYFERTWPQWQYEAIGPHNLEDCRAMNEAWCVQNGCDSTPMLSEETCSVRRLLNAFRELNLTGGLIRLDGRVIAYTVGEHIGRSTLLVHIEKAFDRWRGAYPLINREFVRHSLAADPSLLWVNREDDAGEEGLRKAKLSYHPTAILPKYVIKLNWRA